MGEGESNREREWGGMRERENGSGREHLREHTLAFELGTC